MRLTQLSLIVFTASVIAGCANDYPRVDAAFGKSQARMVSAQTYDPQAAAHPPALAPAIADGQRLENVITAHRKDVPQGSKEVSQTQQFDTGSQSQ